MLSYSAVLNQIKIYSKLKFLKENIKSTTYPQPNAMCDSSKSYYNHALLYEIIKCDW